MKKVILILCAFLGLAGCRSSQNANLDNSTVPTLDVERFMGRWYEIARYEHRFEKDMTHVTATYTLQDDGKIEVLNEGMRDGERKQAKGRAKQPDANDPGKLKVSFFLFSTPTTTSWTSIPTTAMHSSEAARTNICGF